MKTCFEALKSYIEAHPPNYGDGESVLTMLYECHNETHIESTLSAMCQQIADYAAE